MLPVTVLDIRTVNGSLIVSETPSQPARTYPRIPKSLDLIPRISYSRLRQSLVTMSPHVRIEIVIRDRDSDETWYIFKRYHIPIDLQTRSMDALLSEAENLNRIQSQYIIKPMFIVTEKDDDDTFVGYLLPFCPAGSLESVFIELVNEEAENRQPMLLHPKFIRFATSEEWEHEQEIAHLPTIKPQYPKLAWNLKHTWAIEATSALVSLHENGVYSGKIRLQHILLGRDGHLQLCSVAPMDGFLEWDPYRSPEFDFLLTRMMSWPSPTAATDIYALGVILWQIAEEVARIEHRTEVHVAWRAGTVPGSTPQWYQDLVAQCLESEPLNRPTAKGVLGALEARH